MSDKADNFIRIMLSKTKWCDDQFMVLALLRRTNRWNDLSARTLLKWMLSPEDLYIFSCFPRLRKKILAVLAGRRGDSTCARDVERIEVDSAHVVKAGAVFLLGLVFMTKVPGLETECPSSVQGSVI